METIKNKQSIKDLFKDNLEMINLIDSPLVRSDSLRTAAEIIAKLGDIELSKNTFKEALESIQEISDSGAQGRALNRLKESTSKLKINI